MRQINWGIIGCGNVTELKSGPAFGKVYGSQVMAVMRRDSEKAEDYAVRHKIPSWYADADELINDPDINAVYIATPPASHSDYAVRAMEKGKAVYVEKPMAANYTDCVNMHKASIRTGMPLYIAYYRRFLPYFIKVKEILDNNLLGDLLYAKVDFHVAPRPEDFNAESLPWRLIPEIAGAGYFYDLASWIFLIGFSENQWKFQVKVSTAVAYIRRRILYLHKYPMNRACLLPDIGVLLPGKVSIRMSLPYMGPKEHWNFQLLILLPSGIRVITELLNISRQILKTSSTGSLKIW
jgi:hypothetical protein